jgi:hypothetical protein
MWWQLQAIAQKIRVSNGNVVAFPIVENISRDRTDPPSSIEGVRQVLTASNQSGGRKCLTSSYATESLADEKSIVP